MIGEMKSGVFCCVRLGDGEISGDREVVRG